MTPGPSISHSVTVSLGLTSRKHGEPFRDGPRGLEAIPPFPTSPYGFSAVMERLLLLFIRGSVVSPPINGLKFIIYFSSLYFTFFDPFYISKRIEKGIKPYLLCNY